MATFTVPGGPDSAVTIVPFTKDVTRAVAGDSVGSAVRFQSTTIVVGTAVGMSVGKSVGSMVSEDGASDGDSISSVSVGDAVIGASVSGASVSGASVCEPDVFAPGVGVGADGSVVGGVGGA